MFRLFLRENYKVIVFYIVFAITLVTVVLGICQLIPEQLRTRGWFVSADYEAR